jgi:hypothetical protein
MMPVRLDRLGILVSSQHHAVSGCLKPEAQAASAAEQIRGQMRALSPQPGCIGQERLLVLACPRMSGKTDERAPD